MYQSGLTNDDKAIDFIIKYAAMLNSKDIINSDIDKSKFSDEMKLYIAIEFIINNTDTEGEDVEFTDVPKTIVGLAYKELFGSEVTNYTNAYIYKYDSDEALYKKASDNIKSAYIVKIKSIDNKDNDKIIEYYYTFAKDSSNVDDNDCYKTTVKVRNNNEYSFSKYKILDVDSIQGETAGKVKDNK